MWRDLMRKLMGQVYLDQQGAGDGASGGSGGGAGGAGAGDSGGAGGDDKGAGAAGDDKSGAAAGDGKGDAGKAADKTLMQQMGEGAGDGKGGAAGEAGKGDDGKALTPEQQALRDAEKDTRRPKDVPAKFWDAAKGEVKFEAWAKSTNELETRMRTVGLPPKDAGEYKFEIPDVLKNAGFELDPVMSKGFRENALAMGLTQKQFEGVMGEYFKSIPALADQVGQFSADKARAELLKYYKTEEALTENVKGAYQAFMAYADEEDRQLIDQIGNIPAVVRILAKVNRDMGEDPGVRPDAVLDGESLDQLMRGGPGKEDSPYWNADDPRHASVKAKVMQHHEAQARARQRKAA